MCTNGEVNAKVVEQGGIPIQAILNKPPPDNDDDKCSKVDKWADKTKVLPQGGCRGVGYEQQCLLCLEQGTAAQ